jgi:hypothetical protein
MTLKAEEFIRRFLLHVLPKGLVKIRHFGFLANRCRRKRVQLCRRLLEPRPTQPESLNRDRDSPSERHASSVDRCPRCKVGSMRPVEILLPKMFPTAAFLSSPQMDTS